MFIIDISYIDPVACKMQILIDKIPDSDALFQQPFISFIFI